MFLFNDIKGKVLYNLYMINSVLKSKSVNKNKLIPFGFIEKNGIFTYKTQILDGQFVFIAEVHPNGEFKTQLVDILTQEQYTLHLVESASGAFVGSVRSEYEKILTEIADKCFDTDVFQSVQARKVIDYISKKYGDNLEFLWEKFSSNAIWRRKDTKKWYGILLTLSERKLGVDCDKIVEIIDLRAEPEIIEKIIDGKKYFSGYHMNKKHWFTMKLDGSVPIDTIYGFIDKSYLLAKGK